MAVSDAIQDAVNPLVRHDLVSVSALRTVLPNDRLSQYSDQALSAILRELNYEVAGRHTLDGARHSLYRRALDGDAAKMAQLRMDLF